MGLRLRSMLAVALFGASSCEANGTVGGAAVAASESSDGTNDLDTSSSGDALASSSDAPDRSTESDDDDVTASGSDTDVPDDTHPKDATSSGSSSSTSEVESSAGDSSSDESPEPLDPSSSTSTGNDTEATDVGEFAVNCCAPDDTPGCGDPEIESCVCTQDPYCCDTAWDEACVNTATYGECGDPCGGLMPIAPGGCCDANVLGGYGCMDADVQSCVCTYDPYCCTQTWDELCVDYVDDYGCGGCG